MRVLGCICGRISDYNDPDHFVGQTMNCLHCRAVLQIERIDSDNDTAYAVMERVCNRNFTPEENTEIGLGSLINPSDNTFPKNTITLYLERFGKEVLKIDASGNFFVRGNLVENDKQVYDGIIAFLKGAGTINRTLTDNQNMILHGDPMTGGKSRYEILKDSTSGK